MEIPPEGSAAEGAEARGRHGHAPAQVEHDESLQEAAHLKADLPRVVLAKVAGLHAFLNQLGHDIGGGRAAGFEVARILARAFALAKEHELQEARDAEG